MQRVGSSFFRVALFVAPLLATACFATERLWAEGCDLVILATPSGGASLDTVETALDAQFRMVPGAKVLASDPLTLPGGRAAHWTVTLTANKRNRGRTSSWKSCKAAASWSRSRRLNARRPPGITSLAVLLGTAKHSP